MKQVLSRIYPFLLVILAAFALLFPAFINGFPFVYSDTGTYIASGFEGKVPSDRPITYGLFLRHSSLSDSLWYTVFAQGLIIACLLYFLCNKFFRENTKKVFMGLVILLTIGSSLPWFTSLLMADIFTGVSFLLLFLLLIYPPTNSWLKVFMLFVFWLVTGTHLTHAPAQLFAISGLLILYRFVPFIRTITSINNLLLVGVMVLLNLLFLPLLHYVYHGGFSSSRAGQVHLLSRNVENGVAKYYLNNMPDAMGMKLYAYRDSLPESAPEFLWNPNSPLTKIGPWEQSLDEMKRINYSVFTQTECFQLYFSHYLKQLLANLKLHQVGEEFLTFKENTPPGWEIAFKFKKEEQQFLTAKQAEGYWGDKLGDLNMALFFVLCLSVAVTLLGLFLLKEHKQLKLFALLFILFYLGNLLAVNIASGGSRYFSRIDWLFMAIALFILFAFKAEYLQRKKTQV
jgi:hypothetical protein